MLNTNYKRHQSLQQETDDEDTENSGIATWVASQHAVTTNKTSQVFLCVTPTVLGSDNVDKLETSLFRDVKEITLTPAGVRQTRRKLSRGWIFSM